MLNDFLTFRRMLAPIFIQALFAIGSLAAIITGCAILFAGAIHPQPDSRSWLGLGILVLGPIFVRLYCEVLIVVFRINETLTDIRKGATATDPS